MRKVDNLQSAVFNHAIVPRFGASGYRGFSRSPILGNDALWHSHTTPSYALLASTYIGLSRPSAQTRYFSSTRKSSLWPLSYIKRRRWAHEQLKHQRKSAAAARAGEVKPQPAIASEYELSWVLLLISAMLALYLTDWLMYGYKKQRGAEDSGLEVDREAKSDGMNGMSVMKVEGRNDAERSLRQPTTGADGAYNDQVLRLADKDRT